MRRATRRYRHNPLTDSLLSDVLLIGGGIAILYFFGQSIARGAGKVAASIPIELVGGAIQGTGEAIYSGASGVTQFLTGQPQETFGGWLYDFTHPSASAFAAPTPIPQRAMSPVVLTDQAAAGTLPDFAQMYPGGA
jgi:hypothetical protein